MGRRASFQRWCSVIGGCATFKFNFKGDSCGVDCRAPHTDHRGVDLDGHAPSCSADISAWAYGALARDADQGAETAQRLGTRVARVPDQLTQYICIEYPTASVRGAARASGPSASLSGGSVCVHIPNISIVT